MGPAPSGRVRRFWSLVLTGAVWTLLQNAKGGRPPFASCTEKLVAQSGQASVTCRPACKILKVGGGLSLIEPLI